MDHRASDPGHWGLSRGIAADVGEQKEEEASLGEEKRPDGQASRRAASPRMSD